jgi:hypothetical protein
MRTDSQIGSISEPPPSGLNHLLAFLVHTASTPATPYFQDPCRRKVDTSCSGKHMTLLSHVFADGAGKQQPRRDANLDFASRPQQRTSTLPRFTEPETGTWQTNIQHVHCLINSTLLLYTPIQAFLRYPSMQNNASRSAPMHRPMTTHKRHIYKSLH